MTPIPEHEKISLKRTILDNEIQDERPVANSICPHLGQPRKTAKNRVDLDLFGITGEKACFHTGDPKSQRGAYTEHVFGSGQVPLQGSEITGDPGIASQEGSPTKGD